MCEKEVSKVIAELVKMGLVEQLTGEDGQFYFVITEAGREFLDLEDEDGYVY